MTPLQADGQAAPPTTLGADPDALEDLAAGFELASGALRAIRARLDGHVASARWSGSDAVRFRRTWERSTSVALVSSSVAMGALADTLRREAVQQRQASGVSTVGPPATDIATGGPADTGRIVDPPTAGPTAYVPVTGMAPERQFITYDPRGDGRAIEVFGDPATATRIGIWVPGVGSTISDFDDPVSLGARRIWAGSPGLAMIEWLDYDPPDTIVHAAVEMGHGAAGAASDLNEFVDRLRSGLPDGRSREIIIGGHSYGATVAASAAAAGTGADAVVLAGAPGVPVGSVDDMILHGRRGSERSVFVASNALDPVRAGSLLDDLVDGLVHSAGGLLLPRPMSLLLPGSGIVHPGGHTLWSRMHTDATTVVFGATRLPSGPERVSPSDPVGLIDAIRGAHRYTESNPRALRAIRGVYTGQYSVSSLSSRSASSVSSISLY